MVVLVLCYVCFQQQHRQHFRVVPLHVYNGVLFTMPEECAKNRTIFLSEQNKQRLGLVSSIATM